jgi:type I restriction enzyme M protein
MAIAWVSVITAIWTSKSSRVTPTTFPILNDIAKDADGNSLGFHNHSDLDFQKLKGDPDHIGRHLSHYIDGFSENVREIFARFEFDKEIERLEEANRLYLVVSNFADVDLDPRVVGKYSELEKL